MAARAWAFLLASLWLAAPAYADKRVALVIGNSSYASAGVLENPRNDAALMAETLTSEGFDVTLVKDALQADMLAALRKFNDAADASDWALVYYAGHGIELGGDNYLLPTDIKTDSDREVKDGAVPLARVLEAVEGAHKLRLVILDACRNNPFAAAMKRSLRARSVVDRGLKPPEPQTGVLVVYAAAAGEEAEDGGGEHSPFTAALARRLQEPGLETRRLFDVVTADVIEATGGHQRPFLYGSNPIREELFFKPPAPVVSKPEPPSSFAETWEFLQASTDVALLKAFLERLPPKHPLRGQVEAQIAVLPAAKPEPQTAMLTVAPPAVVAPKAAEPTECDRLAASPTDSDLPNGFPSIEFRLIKAEAAVLACRTALQGSPGDRRVQFQLGRALQAGKRYEEAKGHYERAAAAGSAAAMDALGYQYDLGHGVPQNYAKAREWYEKAAAAGNSGGMTGLGYLYDLGHGVPQNYAKAREWYEKAAAAGNANAMNNLGYLHEQGNGVPKNHAKAREWYEKAAAAGNDDSMFNLGVIYEKGEGVPQNYAKAREWYEKAAAAGDEDAKNSLAQLKRAKR